jgi:hypothetical protein
MRVDDSGWPQVRAAILAVVLLVHGVAALPLPHAVQRKELSDPVAVEEVSRWLERLRGLGLVMERDAFEDAIVEVSGAIGGGHRALLKPIRPWFRYTGTGQGWALFANPDTHPSRLQIAVVRGEQRDIVYLRGDATLREYAWLVESRRLRPIYDAEAVRRRPNAAHRRYVRWISEQVRQRDPSVDAVEVTLWEMHTARPGERRRAPKARHTVRSP